MHTRAIAGLEIHTFYELLGKVDEVLVDLDDVVRGVQLYQRLILRVAGEGCVDDLLRCRLVDRVGDDDLVPVDRRREASQEGGGEHEAGRPGVGLLGLQVRVAARVAGTRLGSGRTGGEYPGVVDRDAAAGRVE